ncbi:MAG TPA: fumarylacetoacetate hydrolase family protein [Actinomycetota bacterium]|nr:fumarylacetoacetate hydrolase family protein [Actinomycetota bacterium]
MSYDRRGHRRLGAILGGGGGGRPERVVDLPDLVGHPAFPTTLEALVAASGGTVLDAAVAALGSDEAEAFVVDRPRLLAPLIPRSLRSPDARPGVRGVLGPDDEVPWPAGAGWVDHEPKVVAVLGGWGRPLEGADPGLRVLGYTLANDWSVRPASGDPEPSPTSPPIALGPCLVTADEIDPQTVFLTARVAGEVVAKGNLNGAARDLFAMLAFLARTEGLGRGDAVAVSPFPAAGPGRQLWPSAQVELEAEGFGVLANRIGRRA